MRMLAPIAAVMFAASTAHGAGEVTKIFLSASEEVRNLSLTKFLRRASEPCDFVVRTMFQGTALGADQWTVGCNDGHDYSISLPFHTDGPAKILSCKELAFFNRLLSRGKSKAKLCWEQF